MLVEDHLTELGIEVAASLTSCAKALAWLEANTPDFVLLDYQLTDGPCLELARALKRRGLPFAVLSGFEPSEPKGEAAFRDVPWICKPMSEDALNRVIIGLISLQ
jgi:DNA-binding response OmpR family regulator